MLYVNNNIKVLNEVYFGETPGITRCFQAFCEFRNKYVTKRSIFTGNVNADKDKDLQRFVQEIEREFGLYSYSVIIRPSDQFNACTIIPFFRGETTNTIIEVSKYGYRFKKEAEVSMITVFFTGLLFNADFTNRELFAILLHEIGHNFQSVANNEIAGLTIIDNVLTIYTEFLRLITGDIVSVLKDALIVGVCSNKVIGQLSKMYNSAILGKDKNNIISYINFILGTYDSIKMLLAIPSLILMPICTVILGICNIFRSLINPIGSIKGYLGERFADGFPASYGFGKDISVGLNKMSKYKLGYTFLDKAITQCPVIGHIYNVLMIPGYFLLNVGDVHPRKVARVKSIIKDLEEDLNDPNLSPKLRQQLKKEVSELNKTMDDYYKEEIRIGNPDVIQLLLDNIVYHCFGGGFKLKMSEALSGGLRSDTNKTYDSLLHKNESYESNISNVEII